MADGFFFFLQNWHVKSPFHPFFALLFLVRILLCITNHINILIFGGRGSSHQIMYLFLLIPPKFKIWYNDLTVKCPVFVHLQAILSTWCVKLQELMIERSWFHSVLNTPLTLLLNFNAAPWELMTEVISIWGFLHILYNCENWVAKLQLPYHNACQNDSVDREPGSKVTLILPKFLLISSFSASNKNLRKPKIKVAEIN